MIILFLTALLSFNTKALSNEAIWDRATPITTARDNIYQLSPEVWKETIEQGKVHTLFYPVSTSKLAIPYWPLKNFLESTPDSRVRRLLFDLAKTASPFKSMNDLYDFLGLHPYPKTVQWQTPNSLPLLSDEQKELPMGATLMQTPHGDALTFSCAACHVSDLFGVKVIGLTNRYPRANEFFTEGQRLAPYVNSFIFKEALDTTEGERLQLVQAKKNLKYVGAKVPTVLGLDTSLAQVALSLSKRAQDEYGSRTPLSHRFPRKNVLSKKIADSKPAVWWNLKYKNRWLSDGSIVSGNPVYTNLLWNEIGRGADLKELEEWMVQNDQTIQELTAAVFSTKPPRYENFFGIEKINIEKARRGQAHYNISCKRCHGSYLKGWELDEASTLSAHEQVATIKLTYHVQTPVRNVGTDPGRYEGMNAFASDLNRLKISKTLGTVVIPQKGYVPPPLDGIWARWPYFHNNSVANLCELLTPSSKRVKSYWSGPANDKDRDFDQECVGYPLTHKTPSEWKKNPEQFYDTSREGLSNSGHDIGIFIKDGKEIYSLNEKKEIIEFLKTL